MDTVIKIMLIAFISLLAFSSGVWFGKSLSDKNKEYLALRGERMGLERSVASAPDARDVSKDLEEEVLSEADVERAKQEALAKARGESPATAPQRAVAAASEIDEVSDVAGGKESEKPSAGQASAAPAPTSAAKPSQPKAPTVGHSESTKPDLSAAHRAAQRIAANQAPGDMSAGASAAQNPAVAAGVPREPTSLPRAVGAALPVEFTVQVASYPTLDQAKALADQLVQKGFPAFPAEARIDGRVWYRVSVGSFKTRQEAVDYRARLIKQANLTSAIVQRIQTK